MPVFLPRSGDRSATGLPATGLLPRFATGEHDEIRAGWQSGTNISIACRASGIVGIDLDRHMSGGS